MRNPQYLEDVSGLLRINRGGKVPTDHEKDEQPAVHLAALTELPLPFPLVSDEDNDSDDASCLFN
jgi:hypothetical protein